MHRLYHDFNKLFPGEDKSRVAAPLVCVGTKADLAKLALTLTDGMRVTLYQPDIGPEETEDFLEVEATIRYDENQKCFCADFVYDDLMYRSERKKKTPNQAPEPTAPSGRGSS